MLELDEAIEAVDAAMEYKNELICSRHFEFKSSVRLHNLTVNDARIHRIQCGARMYLIGGKRPADPIDEPDSRRNTIPPL